MARKPGPKSVDDRASALMPGRPPPPPPDDLDEPEAAIWRRVVDDLPSDWISGGSSALLKAYCRHARHCDDLALDIAQRREEIAQARQLEADASEPKAIVRARTLRVQIERVLHRTIRLHGSESERLMRLATKMRLTTRAKYARADAAAAAASKPVNRPWTDCGNNRGRRQ
jgi:hypothetical protein